MINQISGYVSGRGADSTPTLEVSGESGLHLGCGGGGERSEVEADVKGEESAARRQISLRHGGVQASLCLCRKRTETPFGTEK